mmetsp:Transcript_61540/g.74015  ORF Transcript_61540/g.74015 Transcript_61540/m.74015 type:complete len:103 (-) Transcript_61540:739-1047(-)
MKKKIFSFYYLTARFFLLKQSTFLLITSIVKKEKNAFSFDKQILHSFKIILLHKVSSILAHKIYLIKQSLFNKYKTFKKIPLYRKTSKQATNFLNKIVNATL